MKKQRGRNYNGAGLKWPIDVHWYAEPDAVEYIHRVVTFMKSPNRKRVSISDYHRKMILKPGWEKKLTEMRARHRAAGIPDEQFRRGSQG